VAIALSEERDGKIDGRHRPLQVITIPGTGDHDALEWVITMPWNG
jgi:hypothetical protein